MKALFTTLILIMLVSLTALSQFHTIGAELSGFKVPLAIAVGVVALLSVKARLLGIPRLTVYGVVLAGGVLGVEILRDLVGRPWHNVMSWGIPGLCILCYGIRMLVAFTKKYPLPAEETQ